jgi:hypothetical protein
MLYSQIPQSIKKKIATEIKIDLKIFSTTFKDRESSSQETRFSKLALVNEYIDKHIDLGTVDYPGEYVMGSLGMRWGPIEGYSGEAVPLVYFGGVTAETVIGLAGSKKHLLG